MRPDEGPRIRAALDRGLRFVIESQSPNGAWCDFEVDGAVVSDAWVTGYVGAALCSVARVASRPAEPAIAAARTFLHGALDGRAGWGYAGVA
ncbi:MAG TPA: hypothetical protein VK665_09630, partial [Candidatus Elarobacter sp.]|nr:hypothetical protein [Candidatus Elarobacter sp.]